MRSRVARAVGVKTVRKSERVPVVDDSNMSLRVGSFGGNRWSAVVVVIV